MDPRISRGDQPFPGLTNKNFSQPDKQTERAGSSASNRGVDRIISRVVELKLTVGPSPCVLATVKAESGAEFRGWWRRTGVGEWVLEGNVRKKTPDGTILEGNWNNGGFEGEVKATGPNGIQLVGVWSENRLQEIKQIITLQEQFEKCSSSLSGLALVACNFDADEGIL